MKKRKRNWKKISVVLLGLSILLVLFCHWQNTSLVVTNIQYSNAKVPSAFEGYKILQISDLHNAEFGNGQSKLLGYTKKVQPDIIVITGDLIDSNKPDIEIAMEYVRNAAKIAPIYFVSGNHEIGSGLYTELMEELLDAGVVVLDNQSVLLEQEGEYISLLGLGDLALTQSSYMKEYDVFGQELETLLYKASDFTILLSHRPEKFETYVNHAVDLVFAGHAHGGQFRLPFVGGIIAPNQGLFPKYTSGLYEKNETSMIVSRGLGNSIIPVRLFNRPEIVVITLMK